MRVGVAGWEPTPSTSWSGNQFRCCSAGSHRGVILIIIGIVAPIGRVISLIPAPVVGGTAVVVYAIVMGSASSFSKKSTSTNSPTG